MGETNHDAIFARVQKLFERMHQNQKLQKLAKENGMDVKNNAELTDDTINNLAVSIIALSLAKDANDPRYGKLVNTGLQKRSLKIEIINDYKDEANRLIGEYNNGNFQESYNESQDWKRTASSVADTWLKENLPKDASSFINDGNDICQKWKHGTTISTDKSFKVDGSIYHLQKYNCIIADTNDLNDWIYEDLVKGFLLPYSKEIDDPSKLDTLFKTHKDDIPSIWIIDCIVDDDAKEWALKYDFKNKEYCLYTKRGETIKLGKSWTSFMKSLKDE